MDFGAVTLELYFIHELVNQEDTAAVIGVNILAVERVGDAEGVEAGTGIAHDDEHAAVVIAGDTALYLLLGIVFATVYDGVGKGFADGGFDLKFLAGGAFQAARHLHNAFYHRTDGGRVGVECDLNAYHRCFGSLSTPQERKPGPAVEFPVRVAIARYCHMKAAKGQARNDSVVDWAVAKKW